MTELCQRCQEVGEDRRTLRMNCFYDMGELDVPFNLEAVYSVPPTAMTQIIREGTTPEYTTSQAGTKLNPSEFFALRVCKDCRADWMGVIEKWFHEKIQRESNE